MSTQDQFLDVIDRDEADRRFRAAVRAAPRGEETIALDTALGRVLARDVVAPVDVPSFDRSNFDGFAVRAIDTYAAQEESPRTLELLSQRLATAVVPQVEVRPGSAVTIATGGMMPRGADAVVMIEHAEADRDRLTVYKAVTPGFGVSFAGTDVAAGETVLWENTVLTSRDTGVLAAIGLDRVSVWTQPVVAIISTGDEIISPGQAMRPPLVYDSNAQILCDAVRELGGVPVAMGIVRDDVDLLSGMLNEALQRADVVLLSGGTSKGEGDLSYRVVRDLKNPGIVAHGVALKPGKPICLAATNGKPVVILPGFPTSAIFTFHEFVAPVILRMAGRPVGSRPRRLARLAMKVNSQIGRTEYLLVGLVDAGDRLAAYPMGKGSGSVTTFSRAEGFVTIDRHTEMVQAGTEIEVHMIAGNQPPADLVVIGSHCIGLDFLLGQLQRRGYRTKFLAVGSSGGLEAAKRGECDVAGMHLLDAESGRYNEPFLTPELELVTGYRRRQGIVFRQQDARFAGRSLGEVTKMLTADSGLVMVNRNRGSGTRILIDELLGGVRPNGYAVQSRSHSAVAAAVAQGRADWGLAIESAAAVQQLGFLPYRDEQYDFVVPCSRRQRPAVVELAGLLSDPDVRQHLAGLGLTTAEQNA